MANKTIDSFSAVRLFFLFSFLFSLGGGGVEVIYLSLGFVGHRGMSAGRVWI